MLKFVRAAPSSEFDGLLAHIDTRGPAAPEVLVATVAPRDVPVINRILPLSEARHAHELSQSGHTHGKIALRVRNGDGTFERKQS